MPMSSADIIRMVTTRVNLGAVEAARRFGVRGGPLGHAGSVPGNRDQEVFLQDLQPQARPQGRPLHPGARVTAHPNVTALTPADLVWLQRLPQNPEAVSFADAAAVAQLAASISPVDNRSDSRLVQSIWRPLKAHHDGVQAHADLEAAKKPLPPVPASTVPALVDALRAELPQHTDDEVLGRAEQVLTQALTARENEHAKRLAQAEAAVAAIAAAETDRLQTNRTA